MEIYKNRLISEYSRNDLEEMFILKSEELDRKAKQINKLEDQTALLSGKLARVKHDLMDNTKQSVKIEGRMAPTAFRQTVVNSKDLQNQFDDLTTKLHRYKRQRDKLQRELRYFQSLSLFPASTKAEREKQVKKSLKTTDDLMVMISQLSSQNVEPMIVLRLQAAMNVLTGRFSKAEAPMRQLMDLTGSRYVPIFESTDRRKEILKREKKIEDLRRRLAELQRQSDKLAKDHNEKLKQFQEEAEENQKRYKDVMELHHKKEEMEADVTKLSELEIIVGGLQKEINLLQEQKKKIANDNAEHEKNLKNELDSAKDKLTTEIETLKKEIEQIRQQNRHLDGKNGLLRDDVNRISNNKETLIEHVRNLQSEVDKLKLKLSTLTKETKDEILEDPNFLNFLSELSDQRVNTKDLKKAQEETVKYKDELERIMKKSSSTTSKIEEITQAIKDKRELIAELEAEFQTLRIDLGQATADAQAAENDMPMIEFVEGAPHINMDNSKEDIANLSEDETAIIISFQDFDINKAAAGTVNSEMCCTIDILDCNDLCTNFVDTQTKMFDNEFFIPAKNDFMFYDYIRSSGAVITLVKKVGMSPQELGKGFLGLQPFISHHNAFTSSITIKNNDEQPIGIIKYEAVLVKPLND